MAPERIVSLVPSLTEALSAFGVGDKAVGRARYCTQPPGPVPKVGGTKKVDVGDDTYVHHVIRTCGGRNVCGGEARYPVVAPEEIAALDPEVVLLPDEPYLLSAEDPLEFYAPDIPAAREDRVFLVDGKLLTWYGPRMAGSLTQVAALL